MNIANYENQIQADRLLTYGLLDQAEKLYAEVLEAEPDNVEAAFGLARVALERGDEELAHERVTRAVKINPRFDDAIRLQLRLAEIIATRAQNEARGRQLEAEQRQTYVSPSERVAFARNPTMADHRASEAKRNKLK